MSYPLLPDEYEEFREYSPLRFVARINGTSYAVRDFEVDLNAHGATNSADFTIPIPGNPDFSSEFAQIQGDTPVYSELFIGTPDNPSGSPTDLTGLSRVYYGKLAQYDPNFSAGTVEFHCQSLAAPLVAEKIQTLISGITTVQFAAAMATKFGLAFVAEPSSSTNTVQEVLGAMFIGGYNFAASVHGMRIWDLLLQCAQFDDVDVWEDQGTLYYAAPSLIKRRTVDCKYGRDLAVDDGLICSHALQFSKNIEVEARSYQDRTSISTAYRAYANGSDNGVSVSSVTKKTVSSVQFGTPDVVTNSYGPDGTVTTQRQVSGGAASSGFTSPGSESGKEKYIYWLKNQTPGYCNAFALSRWRQISQQEYTAQLRLPFSKAKGIIGITSLIRLHGVPYAKFNSDYWPRKINLSGGIDREVIYAIDAVNHVLPQGAI